MIYDPCVSLGKDPERLHLASGLHAENMSHAMLESLANKASFQFNLLQKIASKLNLLGPENFRKLLCCTTYINPGRLKLVSNASFSISSLRS